MTAWPVVEFGHLLAEPTRNGIYKSKEFHGRGAKMVNMGELFAYPRLGAVQMKRVELSSKELERFSLCKGDLLFARRSLVAEGAGKCSILLEVSEPTAFESSIIRGRLDPATADPLFYFYFFSSPQGAHALGTIRRQVAVAGITGTDLVRLSVPNPPLFVQKTIAKILGSLDDKIELNRRMNQTLEAMAQAIFRDWFVDFGPTRRKLEGATDPVTIMGGLVTDPTRAQELADLFPATLDDDGLPKGWKETELSAVFSVLMGQSPPGSTYNETGRGLPFFQGRRDFSFRFPEERVFCDAPTRIAEKDWTLISVRAPVGDVNRAYERCCIGRGVGALYHSDGLASLSYYTALNLKSALASFDGDGTVFGSINQKQLRALPVTNPGRDIFNAFEEIVSPFDNLVRARVTEIRTLTATRDLLLPKLISGEIHLGEAEQIAEAAQ